MAELFDPTMAIGLFCYFFPMTLSQVHLEPVGARHRVKNNPAEHESPGRKGNNFLKRSSPVHLTLSTDTWPHHNTLATPFRRSTGHCTFGTNANDAFRVIPPRQRHTAR